MMEIRKFDVTKKLSKVAVAGDLIFLSGVVAPEECKTAVEQAKWELDAIEKILEAHGSSRGRMLAATLYVKDVRCIPAVNEVWQNWFEGVEPPTRTCVEAKMASEYAQVEITVTAAK